MFVKCSDRRLIRAALNETLGSYKRRASNRYVRKHAVKKLVEALERGERDPHQLMMIAVYHSSGFLALTRFNRPE